MSLPALASLDDIVTRVPAAVDIAVERTTSLLADASAVVRSFSKQQFTVSQTTEKIRPIGYRVRLPQRPVVTVDGLSLLLLNNVVPQPFPGWWWDGSDEVWLVTGDQVINLAEELQFALRWQTPICLVTYTHGYDIVPDDVIAVVCSMVTRALGAPGMGGVVQEGAGQFTYRISDVAAQGVVALNQAEREILKQYQPRRNATAELRW